MCARTAGSGTIHAPVLTPIGVAGLADGHGDVTRIERFTTMGIAHVRVNRARTGANGVRAAARACSATRAPLMQAFRNVRFIGLVFIAMLVYATMMFTGLGLLALWPSPPTRRIRRQRQSWVLA